MSETVNVFGYHDTQLRAVSLDGEPWFVAADLLAILELDRTALRRLDDDEKGTHALSTPGGDQEMTTVSEPGLFGLILGSRKPEARAFKRWVTHDVLPAIRKTGRFEVSMPGSFADALELAAAEMRRREALEARVAADAPKVEAWEQLAAAVGDFEVGDAAKMLARAGASIGRQRLFTVLDQMHWIFRGADGRWRVYQAAIERGLMTEKPGRPYVHPVTGEHVLSSPQPRITVAGLDRLRRQIVSEARPVGDALGRVLSGVPELTVSVPS